MKFSLAAVVTAALGVYAQNAFVVNDCDIDLYLQSVPYDEEAEPGPVVKLEPGEAFGEEFRPSGSVSVPPAARLLPMREKKGIWTNSLL